MREQVYPITKAFVVVVSEQTPSRALVVSDYRGKWMLPGGVLDRGETPRDAARRELEEESGYDLKVQRFEPVYNDRGAAIFKVGHEFPHDVRTRKRIFDTRGQRNRAGFWIRETKDYGWARRNANGTMEVVDDYGVRKNSQHFRGGTLFNLYNVI